MTYESASLIKRSVVLVFAFATFACTTQPEIVVVDPPVEPHIEPAPDVSPPTPNPDVIFEPDLIPIPEVVPPPDQESGPLPNDAIPYDRVRAAARAETVDAFRESIGRPENDVTLQRDGTTTHSWWPVSGSAGDKRTLRMTSENGQVLGYGLWKRK